MAGPSSGSYKPLSLPQVDDPTLSLRFDIEAFARRLRDHLGRITSAGNRASEPGRKIAQAIQAQQLQALRDGIAERSRPQRPSELLVRAIQSPEYISYNNTGFVVGTDRSLSQNPVRYYWRNLEYGSEVHVGRLLHGFFTGPEGGSRYPALESRFRSDARLIQLRDFKELAPNQRGKLRRNPGGKGAFAIEIRRPIPEGKFLRPALKEWGPGRVGEVYQEYFARQGIRISLD